MYRILPLAQWAEFELGMCKNFLKIIISLYSIMFGVKLFFFLFFTAFAVCMFSTMFATPVFMIGLGIYSLGAGKYI